MDKISKSWLLLGNILFLDIGWQSQLKELKHNLEKASRPSLGAKDGGRGWTHHRPSHQRGPYSGQCHHTSSCWGTHLVPALPLPSQSMVPGAASFSKSSFRVLITIRVPKHRDTDGHWIFRSGHDVNLSKRQKLAQWGRTTAPWFCLLRDFLFAHDFNP